MNRTQGRRVNATNPLAIKGFPADIKWRVVRGTRGQPWAGCLVRMTDLAIGRRLVIEPPGDLLVGLALGAGPGAAGAAWARA